MKTVENILTEHGIAVPDNHKIIFYNNRCFTSPIDVLLEDEYQDDYAVLILPNDYPAPKTAEAIAKAAGKGFPLRVLHRVF
jgi:hypothetical protein